MSKASKSNSKVLSTWTPLNNEETNRKVFEERRELVCKWYEKWNDFQKKKMISDLMKLSKIPQLEIMANLATKQVPVRNTDFTRLFPRVLTLYIFSYLDPRTLCRCAQVCWSWKYLSEIDQLWMVKCLRVGWNLPFSPGPFEQGLWKRNYIENIKGLQHLTPVAEIGIPVRDFHDLEINTPKSTARSKSSQMSNTRRGHKKFEKLGSTKPAWKGSDTAPKDIRRYNYLNNDDEVEIIKALREHGLSGPRSLTISNKAQSRVKTGRRSSKAKSMTNLTDRSDYNVSKVEKTLEEQLYGGRPLWAQPHTAEQMGTRTTNHSQSHPNSNSLTQQHIQSRAPLRSDRDLPMSGAFEAFTQKPWSIPDQTDSD